jgi:hypothetical protein
MFDDDADYEFHARYDDHRERYGDRCPGCGTLRWGGDCPACMSCDPEPEDIDIPVSALSWIPDREPTVEELRRLNAENNNAIAWAEDREDDDIPF